MPAVYHLHLVKMSSTLYAVLCGQVVKFVCKAKKAAQPLCRQLLAADIIHGVQALTMHNGPPCLTLGVLQWCRDLENT